MVHGIIGAGMGALSNGEALDGAIGAVVGEVVGETYANAHPEGFNPSAEDYDPSLRESLKNRGKILTQISAALAAAFLGENPNVAACTALNAVQENAFSLGSYEDLSLHNRTEKEVEELEAALAQETNPEKREQLEGKLSWRRDMLQTRDDQQAEYARIGERYLGPVCDWGLSEIENETYRRIAGSWNTTLDGVHSWTSNMREFHSPLVLDGLNIGSTLSGIDFAADLFKLPTTKGGAVLFAMPMATTAFSVLKTAGRGTINSLRNVPIFDVRNSGLKNVVDSTSFSPQSLITPLERRGRVLFDGVEFRAVRDLGHMSEVDLYRMLKKGVAPYDRRGIRIDGHHYRQQHHREPGAFIIEIPLDKHFASNKIQHPKGMGKVTGLNGSQRKDWNNLRKRYYKERAKEELNKRFLLNE